MEMTSPEFVGFSTQRLQRIYPVMQGYIDRQQLSGLSTLVARRGKVAHFEQYGLMDIEAQKPMQADTIFRIYSMTKPITNVAAMMLYEEGHFLLNDPVSRFIPGFAGVKVLADADDPTSGRLELEREVTIRDLMLHTAGLAYDLEGTPLDVLYEQAGLFRRDKSLQEIVAELVKLPSMNQPGSAWRTASPQTCSVTSSKLWPTCHLMIF